MKKIFITLITLILLLPIINVQATSKEYKDLVAPIVKEKVSDNKINLYLFYSESCPHCHDEIEYLKTIKEKYKEQLNIYKYEVTKNKDNSKILESVKKVYGVNNQYVPFTVIGEDYIVGFSESTETSIESIIDNYINDTNDKKFDIPLIGKITGKDASLTLIATILGFIDGFNPCAMWILLLLINMTISIKNRKKMLLIGLTFILTGGLIYFLSMLGIGIILDLTMISTIRNLIAIFAITLGIYNLYTYYKTRKVTGCHVVKKEKRKTIITKINHIINKNNVLLIILGTIILASSVNLVELACSLGFPTIFLELLTINNITGITKILYLLLYILFYIIDDLIVFFIALFTLKTTGISTKYNKYVNLIGGLLMILMGLLLIFKPEWIMFNF